MIFAIACLPVAMLDPLACGHVGPASPRSRLAGLCAMFALVAFFALVGDCADVENKIGGVVNDTLFNTTRQRKER